MWEETRGRPAARVRLSVGNAREKGRLRKCRVCPSSQPFNEMTVKAFAHKKDENEQCQEERDGMIAVVFQHEGCARLQPCQQVGGGVERKDGCGNNGKAPPCMVRHPRRNAMATEITAHKEEKTKPVERHSAAEHLPERPLKEEDEKYEQQQLVAPLAKPRDEEREERRHQHQPQILGNKPILVERHRRDVQQQLLHRETMTAKQAENQKQTHGVEHGSEGDAEHAFDAENRLFDKEEPGDEHEEIDTHAGEYNGGFGKGIAECLGRLSHIEGRESLAGLHIVVEVVAQHDEIHGQHPQHLDAGLSLGLAARIAFERCTHVLLQRFSVS